jgi:hypothetical protein
MSAIHPLRGYPEMPEPRNDIERLLQDMVASDNMEFSAVSNGHFFTVGLGSLAREALHCSCHADVWIARTSAWHIYAWPHNTERVRFARAPDPHAPDRETLGIHLVGPNGEALRGHFTPLYDGQDQPLAAPFGRWEALRAKYGGQDETEVENGMLEPTVRPPAWKTSWR